MARASWFIRGLGCFVSVRSAFVLAGVTRVQPPLVSMRTSAARAGALSCLLTLFCRLPTFR